MQVYNDKDLDVFNDSVKDIIEKVKIAQLDLFEPKKSEMDKVMHIINKYIKDKNRKVYGGYALNLLLKSKDPKDAIYNDIEFADIDIYSPEPLRDLINISNILHDKGFKDPMGKEAQHKETYSIFVNKSLYCDITYVPKNIYNRMPFVDINGFKTIHPHFMMIDFFRMFTDPLTSYWRLEKIMPRFYKLQKHYPFLKIKKEISYKKTDDLIYNKLLGMIKNKKSLIVVGGYAYNKFLEESKLNRNKLNNPLLNVVSVDYENDGKEIIDKLKNSEYNNKLNFVEHYPFFQFTSHSVIIYYNNNAVMKIQGNNKKCYPYRKIKLNNDDFIQIGSFDLTLMFNMIEAIIYRTNKDIQYMNNYQRMISDMIDMRNKFFKDNPKKTFNDETLFKSFQIECTGITKDPVREYRELIDEKRKKKSGPLIFKYEPEIHKKDYESEFIFSNSSGNPINNVKNLKLNKN